MFGGRTLFKLLDHRFDAFAGETHENLAPRAAVALGAGAVALMLLPWRLCVIWTASILAFELWGWFASRRQYLGRPVLLGDRLGFGYAAESSKGRWNNPADRCERQLRVHECAARRVYDLGEGRGIRELEHRPIYGDGGRKAAR